jgi:hypothetical protein
MEDAKDGVMPRAPRFIPAGSMVEITTRTIGGRFLLKPSPELNGRILGTLGRALALYPVALHAFVFLSNHWHALATVESACRLAAFAGYVNGNVAKAVQELHSWSEIVWSRRAEMIPVVDDAAAEGRLRYILSHGAKEGLVASPLDWPGVSSARALALGETLVGTWRRDSSKDRAAPEAVPVERYPIELVPIPSHAELPTAARQARARSIIEEIAREVREQRGAPMGRDAVLAQDPRSAPEAFVRRRAPRVHAALAEPGRAFLTLRGQFVAAFRDAAHRAAADARELAATFPEGAFPSPLPPSRHGPGTAILNASCAAPLYPERGDGASGSTLARSVDDGNAEPDGANVERTRVLGVRCATPRMSDGARPPGAGRRTVEQS